MRGKLIFLVVSVCVAISSCGMKSDELNSTELQSTEQIDITVLNNSEISELIEDTPIDQIEIKDISEDVFVNVKEYIPEIIVDLRYATDNNFTGQKIYEGEISEKGSHTHNYNQAARDGYKRISKQISEILLKNIK